MKARFRQMWGRAALVFLLSGCALPPMAQPQDGNAAIAAAKDACVQWQQNLDDPQARQSYHQAVTDLLLWLDQVPVGQRQTICAQLGLRLEIAPEVEPRLHRYLPAQKVDKSPLDHWHDRQGLGVPVVAWRKNDGLGKWDKYRPPEGIAAPVTVLLQPDKSGNGKWVLQFCDPYHTEDVIFAGKRTPLAADLSAPFAMILDRARALHKSGRKGMLNPSGSERKEKLYLIQPYDPQRIPLIMVHGLQSTPVAFGNLSCQVAADPVLYKHYQIWHYHYPTGTPVLVNAAVFRRQLNETLKELDPEGDDFATRNLVVIGHSMGGILTHTLTCDSGYKLWDSVMLSRPEKFICKPAFREQLEPVFLFKQDRRVKRVIFVAVPHRGSSYADNWIGDLGQQLFRGDHEFHSLFAELVRDHRDQVNPFLLDLIDRGKVSSIRTLSARSPALMALAEIPPRVPFHNIMGQRRPGPVERGSDGIVPYSSSWMSGAESEVIVRSGHNAFRHPDAVIEIKRILRQHLQPNSSAHRASH